MSNDFTLAQRLEHADSSTDQSWIITEMLLNAYLPVISESVVAAAVSHWFTPEILATLLELPIEEAQERYEALQTLSIVQPFGNLGCTLHDLTRSGILRNLVTTQSAVLQRYSEKLLDYFAPSDEPQREVERIYHLLMVNPTEGRRILEQNARFWRRKGDFAAVENLLRHYRELIELGWLSQEHGLELEQQEYWTVEALADYGKGEIDDQSKGYLRKALEHFTTPGRLTSLLSDEPARWREQIDTHKRNFVLSQLESPHNSDDLDRQAFWMTELSGIYRNQGNLETALQHLNEALALDPDNAVIWEQRGRTYGLMNRYSEALVDFTRAIGLVKDYIKAIANRGLTYRLLERYEESLADFTYAIELDEKYIGAHFNRGLAYRLMKRYEEALVDFDQAIELDEKDTWAIASRGLVYLLTKRIAQALADFDHALMIKENDWSFYCRGLLHTGQNNQEMAHLDITRAIEMVTLDYSKDPQDSRNILNLMVYYLVLGDHTAAERFLREASDVNTPALYWQEALQDLEDLITILPNHAQAPIFFERVNAHLENLRHTG